MRKVKISPEDTMYSTDEWYSPSKANMDKELFFLLKFALALGALIAFVIWFV
jgi:hypothetical protein